MFKDGEFVRNLRRRHKSFFDFPRHTSKQLLHVPYEAGNLRGWSAQEGIQSVRLKDRTHNLDFTVAPNLQGICLFGIYVTKRRSVYSAIPVHIFMRNSQIEYHMIAAIGYHSRINIGEAVIRVLDIPKCTNDRLQQRMFGLIGLINHLAPRSAGQLALSSLRDLAILTFCIAICLLHKELTKYEIFQMLADL